MAEGVDLGVPYAVRHSARAKRLQAAVRGGEVEVIVPRWAKPRHVHAFIAEAAPWIVRQAGRLQERAGTVLPQRCEDGAMVKLEGRQVPLRIARTGGRRVVVQEGEGEITVGVPASVGGDDVEGRVRKELDGWLRAGARAVAEEHVATYAARLRVQPRGLRIKNQKTLWGSCGRTGLINLNWRLIAAPPPVFEYIVVHELCHLEQRNHGPRFWALVGRLMPGYERPKRWLRDHGMQLG